MRNALILSVAVVLVSTLLGAPALRADPESDLQVEILDLSAPGEAAICPAPPAGTARPMMPCSDCTVLQFSPRFGTVCSYAGSCVPGAHGCCEYNCACGVSNGLPGTPSNACDLTLPSGCCPNGQRICPRKYCNGVGEACFAVGCGIDCCEFQCGQPDPTCTGFDPIPPEAC